MQKLVFSKLFAIFLFFSASLVHAQDSELAKVRELMVSPWIVTIDKAPRARLLRISEVTKAGENVFELSAVYGFLSDKQTEVKGVLLFLTDKGHRLTFSSQTNSRVDVLSVSEKTFKGTFAPAKGASAEVTLSKSSEEQVQAAIASEKSTSSAANSSETAVPANVVIPEKISGRWTNTKTGYGQAFSMEKITVTGNTFSADFTQWFDSSCVVRAIPVIGAIKAGAITFTFTPPCYSAITTTIDFVSSMGVYRFGNGPVLGTYAFK